MQILGLLVDAATCEFAPVLFKNMRLAASVAL